MTPKDIDSGVYADIATEPSGGSSREVTVVSRDDLARAGDLLKNKKESGAKERLKSQFDSQTLPMETTFTEQYSSFTPSVAQDSEASDRVLLRTTYTASMYGAARTDVDNFLKQQQLQKQVANKDEQKFTVAVSIRWPFRSIVAAVVRPCAFVLTVRLAHISMKVK